MAFDATFEMGSDDEFSRFYVYLGMFTDRRYQQLANSVAEATTKQCSGQGAIGKWHIQRGKRRTVKRAQLEQRTEEKGHN